MFYRLESGRSPVEMFFDSLTNKQFEKIAFVRIPGHSVHRFQSIPSTRYD